MKKSVLFLFMALCSIGLMAQSAVTGPGNAAPAPSVETVLQNAVTGLFSGTEAVSPLAAQVKYENSLRTITDIDLGIVNLYMQYPAHSRVVVRVSVMDTNNKRYWIEAHMIEGMETSTIFPKYDAPIIMAEIISVTPTEDERYYYTF